MRVALVLTALVLPLLSVAQGQVTTSMITSVGLGPNRQETTVVQATVITLAAAAASSSSASASGSNSASQSGTSGNATSSAGPSSSLPAAPSSVAGGDGSGPNGAPSPGASAPGGIYGPPDGYISAASALRKTSMIVGLVGAVVGGALTFV
ncbi:hypothetical protein BJ138DRAFT_1109312 [Hygrophoropsis aurantiaca]|uniref:Uncharacterized protein n=1 Tax=Hygrophoropsis aurantiaca TaxID=72124 RepID=A0ACB8ARE4_9AGAM|nr:hypothetical protein BJ138DRAFT_1109312 [Hygrophoropsis aurantiaca]